MRGVIFQTQKYEKVIRLVDYAKCLYRRQPDWLRNAFPLAKPIDSQPKDRLEFASGSYVLGIPGGADQLRGYHPGDTSTMKLLSSRRPESVITRLSPRSRGRSSCVQLPDQDGTPIFDTTSSATTKIEVLDRFLRAAFMMARG
jgi:hypothetical protein